MPALHVILSLGVLALAATSVVSRRRAQAGIAFALCTIGMAGVVLTLSAELVALFWALGGTGILLVHLIAGARDRGDVPPTPQLLGLGHLGLLFGALLLWLSLLGVLVVGHLPGEDPSSLLIANGGRPSTEALLLLAHGRYAPALLGVSFTLMAACLGSLAVRRGR